MKRLTVLLLLATLAPASAWAQADTAESQRLYKEGWRLYQQKHYAEACPLLDRSLAEAPTISTRGALALCYEQLGKWASAYKAWRTVADQAKEAGAVEATRMKRALQKVEQLAPHVAQVVFQMNDNAPGLKVTLDGQAMAATDLNVAIPVDPGAHTVDAKAPDRVDWHGTFELDKPDEGKTRSFPVGPLAPIERVERADLPQNVPGGPYIPAGPQEPKRRMPTLRYVAIAAAGAGVVGLAVGTVFALQANSKWSDAKSAGCDDNGTCRTPAGVALVNDAGSKATIGTIGFVAGGALLVGGAALWFFTPSSEEVPPPSVTPTVSIGPGGAHLGIKGSF